MSQFSPQLTQRLQTYFAKHYEERISPEQANLYLDSLANLYLAVYRGRAGRDAAAGATALLPTGGRRPP